MNIRIHRAVAETYIENPFNKPFVNHIDGNKSNNTLSNLEWVTASENMRHAAAMKLLHPAGANTKLSKDEVAYIRKNYIARDPKFGSRALGKKFGVDHMQILRIVKRKTYVNA